MKHNTLLLLFLFSLLPSWGWGEELKTETIKLDELVGSYRITENGEYTFTGKYNSTPDKQIDDYEQYAVIDVAKDLEVTIILDDATIDLPESDNQSFNGFPLSAKYASKVNLKLKGNNTLSTLDRSPGIWAPEKPYSGIIIEEYPGCYGSLNINLPNAEPYSGIGGRCIPKVTPVDQRSYIKINSGIINISSHSSGIGGFNGSQGCAITITGGTVTATGNIGPGIGSRSDCLGDYIIITGGIVTATSTRISGLSGVGSGDTFSTGKDGTAFINASGGEGYTGIGYTSYKNNNPKGLIFDGKEGKIYGDSYTLTANATIEKGKTLIIESGQELIIKEGATLSIAEEAILNIAAGAKLTNNNEIKCDGEIKGDIGDDNNNNKIKYAVTYDLNYDNSPENHIEYVVSGADLPEYSVSREFYTFDGWHSDPITSSVVGTITKATTVYAHWVETEPIKKDPIDDIIATYGTSFEKELTPEMFIENASEVGNLKISKVTANGLPDGLQVDQPYIIKGTPTVVNETGVSIEIEFTYNDNKGYKIAVTLKVNKAPLTITPKPDQKLLDGETILYDVEGVVNGNEPSFTGSLGATNGKVVINDFELTEESDKFYTLSLTPDVPIIYISNIKNESYVTLSGTTNPDSGTNYPDNTFVDEVTFTAPDGFLIALVSSQLKSSPSFSKSFKWNQVGNYTLTYRLKRESGDGSESGDFQKEITIIKSKPDPEPDPEPIDPPVVITYDVELPEVEGVRIDVGAGIHKVDSWGTFTFTITVDEGYRMHSLPVVKANGSEIACSSSTDSSYTYKIKYIRTDQEIAITGILKDLATANNEITSPQQSWKIVNGIAYITVANPTLFTIVEINGNTTTYNLAPGTTPIYNLPRLKVLLFKFDKKEAVKVIIN